LFISTSLSRVAVVVTLALVATSCASSGRVDDLVLSQASHSTVGAPALRGWVACGPDDRDCDTCVDDVPAAFDAIVTTPAHLGFHVLPSTPALSSHRGHFQGMGRSRLHPRYMYLSRSDALAGNGVPLEVVKISSWQSWDRGGSNLLADGLPPLRDSIVKDIYYTGAEQNRYHHACGMQVVGDWLVVGVEDGGPGRAVFYDLADPENPIRRYAVENHASSRNHAGLASLVKLRDGRFLLMIGAHDSRNYNFFVTDDLSSPSWRHLDTWYDWEIDHQPSYQSAQFITQCDGTIYFIGTHAEATASNIINPILGRENWMELFEVDWGPRANVRITRVASKRMSCGTGSGRWCDLRAAAAPYVTPSGDIVLYATEHENGGVAGTVRMAEFAPRTGLVRSAGTSARVR